MDRYQQRFEQFRESRQPPVALRLAMEDFFQEDLPEPYRQAYGVYLRRRIRPLAEKLIDRDDVEKLEQLEQLGWLDSALVDAFARMAAQKQKTACLVWLLQKKQETYGFQQQDFSL